MVIRTGYMHTVYSLGVCQQRILGNSVILPERQRSLVSFLKWLNMYRTIVTVPVTFVGPGVELATYYN